jgi:hypothetical protein
MPRPAPVTRATGRLPALAAVLAAGLPVVLAAGLPVVLPVVLPAVLPVVSSVALTPATLPFLRYDRQDCDI